MEPYGRFNIQDESGRAGQPYRPAAYHATAMDSWMDPSREPGNPNPMSRANPSTGRVQDGFRPSMTQAPAELGILSAEMRRDDVEPARRRSPGNVVLGVLINEDQDSNDSVPTSIEATVRPSKRARATGRGSRPEAEQKRSRGRPRLDMQDENATDRRRTQIRLAQRAYRQRKETTIASLQSRVTELEEIIDGMNKAFLDFNDSAIRLGVVQSSPLVAQKLQDTTQRFLSLAQLVNPEESTHDHDEVGSAGPAGNGESNAGGVNSSGRRRSAHSLRDQSPPSAQPLSNGPSDSGGVVATTTEAAPSMYYASPMRRNPAPEISTYVHEPQFGRRLHRATCEAAFRLLGSSKASIARKQRAFQYSFYCNDINELMSHVLTNLEETNNPNWTPRSFYPPVDGVYGPAPVQRVISSGDGADEVGDEEGSRMAAGVPTNRPPEGIEFMTAVDVEQYLQGKGISVNSEATIIEVTEDDTASPSTDPSRERGISSWPSAPTSLGDFHTPPKTPSGEASRASTDVQGTMQFPSYAAPMESEPIQMQGTATSQASQSRAVTEQMPFAEDDLQAWLGIPPATEGWNPRSAPKARMPRTVDLSILFSELKSRAMCIGQGPGFSKPDIEIALSAAMEAW